MVVGSGVVVDDLSVVAVVVVASVEVVTRQFTYAGRNMPHSNLKTRFPGHI